MRVTDSCLDGLLQQVARQVSLGEKALRPDAPGRDLLLPVEQLLAEHLDIRRSGDAQTDTVAFRRENLNDDRVADADDLLWLAREDEHRVPPCLLSPLTCSTNDLPGDKNCF